MSATELEVWLDEVTTWLAGTYGTRAASAEVGEAHPFAVFHNLPESEERALLEGARDYRRRRFDAGYGALTLPEAQGGAGLPASFASAFARAEQSFAVPPSTELISVTTGLVGPAVAMFGSEEQRERYAMRFLRTDLLACQLFSEPGAGSDLASLRTRAVADGDDWVVNGQKVWTSGAKYADFGLLLARTDPEQPKHTGITAFLLPLDSPGVEVRPIRQMSGGASFSEVFLSDVRIPDARRIGAIGQGWKVATATLAFERTASGSSTRRKGGTVSDLVELATRRRVNSDPVVRQTLADVYIRAELRAATADRVARAVSAGVSPGPAASVGKVLASDLLQRIGDAAVDIGGEEIAADSGDGTFLWADHVLGAPGYRLAGGTDEIQRNIIAERVLGLPPEPRVDRGVPWSELDR